MIIQWPLIQVLMAASLFFQLYVQPPCPSLSRFPLRPPLTYSSCPFRIVLDGSPCRIRRS